MSYRKTSRLYGYGILSGVWLIGVGMLMFVSPNTALRFLGKAASTNLINYTEISIRMIWGIALVWQAEFSKFSGAFQIIGWFIVLTSAILFFVPRKWHAMYAVWWSRRLSARFIKIASPVSMATGGFLIYAVF